MRGVVNFAGTVCTYDPEQSTFSCSSGPNPSEQKPKARVKLFCNGLSSVMTRTVPTRPRSRTCTSHLRLLRGSSWTKLQTLCFRGKALSAMEAVVEVLFNLYMQTTVTSTTET